MPQTYSTKPDEKKRQPTTQQLNNYKPSPYMQLGFTAGHNVKRMELLAKYRKLWPTTHNQALLARADKSRPIAEGTLPSPDKKVRLAPATNRAVVFAYPGTKPTKLHPNMDVAKLEAKRLSELYPQKRFFVYVIIETSITVKPERPVRKRVRVAQ